MRLFAFSLASEQGKSLKELENSMDAAEFMEWVAYKMTQDSDMRKKLTDEISLEVSAQKTAEQRAADIKTMFMMMGGGK